MTQVESASFYSLHSNYLENSEEQAVFWKNKAQEELVLPLEYFEDDSGYSWEERYYCAKEVGRERVMENIMCDVISDVLKRLKELNTGESKIYFAGIYDGTHPKFEEKSNLLQIGVMANDKRVGFASLRFLNSIISACYDGLLQDLINFPSVKEGPLTVESIIDLFVELEEPQSKVFSPTDTFTRTLSNSNEITTTLDKVDVWTFDRINKLW